MKEERNIYIILLLYLFVKYKQFFYICLCTDKFNNKKIILTINFNLSEYKLPYFVICLLKIVHTLIKTYFSICVTHFNEI